MGEVAAEVDYVAAIERDKSDFFAMKELIQLYLKVGLPSAAKKYCDVYHTALVRHREFGAEELQILLAEHDTFVETATQDIASPRLRFQCGDRVLCSSTEGRKEGVVMKVGYTGMSV
jgi:hypothetical protein